MANASRAPFYAPRPGDDVYWTPSPIANGAIRTTTTQVKFFGQPGQAPTKRWSPIYTFDDPAVWYEPTFQNGPVRVTLTQTKFYGQNGQTVTHNWAQNYTNDDPAVWSGSPISSETIHPLLTAAGQVKSKQWLFGLDDPSVWTGSPISSDTIHPLLTALGLVKPKQWPYTLDDPAPWVSWTNRNSRVLQITTSPFAPYPWSFNNTDDAAPWQYTYQRSTLTPNTFGFNLRWVFNFADDPSVWTPYTNRNQSVLTPVGTPFIPTQWRFGTPVDEPWQQTTPGKPTTLVAVTPSPFTIRQPVVTFDDSALWQYTPPYAIALQLIVYRTPNLYPVIYDDPSAWQWQHQSNSVLSPSVLNPFSPRFISALDEPPVWTYGLRPVSITLTATAPTPLTSSQWHFGSGYGFDDFAVWNAESRNAFFTQTFPVSFKAGMWSLNLPQSTDTSPNVFPGSPPTNINLFPPIPPVVSPELHDKPFFANMGKLMGT